MKEVSINDVKGKTLIIPNFDPIKIKQKGIIYILNIKTNEDNITFSINDKEQLPSVNYIRTMSLKEIKELNNIFNVLNSFNDFYDYLKSLSNNHKLNIKKENARITIIFYVEVLLKQQKIEIDLYQAKNDINLNIKEIYQELFYIKNKIKEIEALKNENNDLKNKIYDLENKNNDLEYKNNDLEIKINEFNNQIVAIKSENNKLNNEIYTLKMENNQMKLKIEEHNKEINNLKENPDKYITKSEIMKISDKDMLYKEIENKMNKKIKEIQKLYQATRDGGDPINFHLKCDNIPNTLVLIKSEGNRRFGGFTPIPWKSEEGYVYKQDSENKTFVFSLDNKKIYYLKYNDKDAVYHNKNKGPCFGGGCDIGIKGNPIKENKLYTNQFSYDYKGDSNALSEFNYSNRGKVLEYEVFQVIFY